MADTDDFEEMGGGGDLVGQVFEQESDAEGAGEGFQVLDGGEGVLDGVGRPGVVGEAHVQGNGGEGDLLGGLEGAFDLVHGLNAAAFIVGDQVEGGGGVAGPAGVGVGGLVEGGSDVVGAEPVGDLADDGAVGVVEVVAGGEDLDVARAGFGEGVQDGGIEGLLEQDVGGDSGLHRGLAYRMAGRGGMDLMKVGDTTGVEIPSRGGNSAEYDGAEAIQLDLQRLKGRN